MRTSRGHAPVIQDGGETESTPVVPGSIAEAIEKSRYVLDLPEDWDEAGGRRIETMTWTRATELLSATAAAIGSDLPAPRIGPCSDGSIDLYWKTPSFTLLINVQATEGAESDFYGETADGIVLKGTFSSGPKDLTVILRPLLGC